MDVVVVDTTAMLVEGAASDRMSSFRAAATVVNVVVDVVVVGSPTRTFFSTATSTSHLTTQTKTASSFFSFLLKSRSTIPISRLHSWDLKRSVTFQHYYNIPVMAEAVVILLFRGVVYR